MKYWKTIFFYLFLLEHSYSVLGDHTNRLVVTFTVQHPTPKILFESFSGRGDFVIAKAYGRRLVLEPSDDHNLWNATSLDAALASELGQNYMYLEEDLHVMTTSTTATYGWPYGGGWSVNVIDWWRQSSGSPEITVAVIDTGILESSLPHFRHITPGYDFVSENIADDGDGRDSDYFDVIIDENTTCVSPYHGTAMSSIVTGELEGSNYFRGMCSNCSLFPIRGLSGCEGGFASDISDSIFFALKDQIIGVPLAERKADIISLSMSSSVPAACPSYLASAFSRAAELNVTVVVAAGNQHGDNARNYFPCNCHPDVICTMSSDGNGMLSSFSNRYGTVAVPGQSIPVLTSALEDQAIKINMVHGTSASTALLAGFLSLGISIFGKENFELSNYFQNMSTYQTCTGDNTNVTQDNECGSGLIMDLTSANETLLRPQLYDTATMTRYPETFFTADDKLTRTKWSSEYATGVPVWKMFNGDGKTGYWDSKDGDYVSGNAKYTYFTGYPGSYGMIGFDKAIILKSFKIVQGGWANRFPMRFRVYGILDYESWGPLSHTSDGWQVLYQQDVAFDTGTQFDIDPSNHIPCSAFAIVITEVVSLNTLVEIGEWELYGEDSPGSMIAALPFNISSLSRFPVPLMTQDDASILKYNSQYGASQAVWKMFDGDAVNGEWSGKCCSEFVNSPVNNSYLATDEAFIGYPGPYVIINMSDPIILKSFRMFPSGWTSRFLNIFRIYGINPSSWETLTPSSEGWVPLYDQNMGFPFTGGLQCDLSRNTQAFSAYALVVRGSRSEMVQIREWEMYGVEGSTTPAPEEEG